MPLIRVGQGPADVAAMAALRRAWVEESAGPVEDGAAFEREFAAWWADESPRRTGWLALLGDDAVGMLNLTEFRRMPKPGEVAGRWGYVSNVFVRAEHRDRGVGRSLLDAALAESRRRDYVRLVLAPSERSVPFYRRAGFDAADSLLLRPL